MNTPNPLVPQGTKPNTGKSTFRITVLTIMLLHVALIGGFLIQGCSPSKETVPPVADTNLPPVEPTPAVDTNASNALPAPGTLPGAPVAPAPATAPGTAQAPGMVPPAVAPIPASAPAIAPAPAAELAAAPANGSEYVIVKGDTLAIVAKKHHVTLKALQDANPGVDSRKLKLGQKIQIPASAAPAASADNGAPATGGEETVYTVKSGDVLIKIAKVHGTTVNAIKTANHLKSNALKVGQKLKIPAGKALSATTPAAETAPAPAPVVTPAPVSPAPLR
jgi:LysM repeat protein